MADQRIQATELMVGNGHATLADTLNRHAAIEHNSDGTHSTITADTGTAAAPSIGWIDTGFWENTTDVIGIAIGGSNVWNIYGVRITGTDANGPAILNETAADTNPTLIPNSDDLAAGVGGDTGEVSLITNNLERLKITDTAITSTVPVVLPSGTAAAPSTSWDSGDLGFYLQASNVLGFAEQGNYTLRFDVDGISSQNAAGFACMNEAASNINPTLCPNKAEQDTGWGWASDTLHGILGGTSYYSFTTTALTVTPAIIANGGIRTDTVTTIKVKVLNIGDWDMDTDAVKTVAHGLTMTKIRGVTCLIRNDTDDVYTPVGQGQDGSAGYDASISSITSNVTIAREAAGYFDNTGFDSTSYNRGWVTITYEA